MKYLKKFNENYTKFSGEEEDNEYLEKLRRFYDDYKKIFTAEEEDEYSNTDLLSLIGDLLNKYNMDHNDIEHILSKFENSFDVNGLLDTFLDESDTVSKKRIPSTISIPISTLEDWISRLANLEYDINLQIYVKDDMKSLLDKNK